jgi:hypothetical protein
MVSEMETSRRQDAFTVCCTRCPQRYSDFVYSKDDDGFITARVRTFNVLYVAKRLTPRPEFEPAKELHIDKMWKWTGKSWGGLPDGSSIVDQLRKGESDA